MSYRPSFAQNQLHKHGWENGKGLGKSENGIKSAIKVKVKNNKDGLGHDAGADFTFHWWDHIFNKTANSIEIVDNGDEEVSIKKNENAKKIVPQLMYNKRPLPVSMSGKPLLYGTFVSGGTISTNDCDSNANTPEQSSDSESDPEEKFSTDLLDRAYKRTGLTGHKGARHGLKLSGKLKRIQEQEQLIKNNETTNNKSDKKKKKKKDKLFQLIKDDNDLTNTKSMKKKKKRKLSQEEKVDDEIKTDETPKKKQKKKKKKEL